MPHLNGARTNGAGMNGALQSSELSPPNSQGGVPLPRDESFVTNSGTPSALNANGKRVYGAGGGGGASGDGTNGSEANDTTNSGPSMKTGNDSKPIEATIVDLFDHWAHKAPHRTAAEWQGESITYSDLRNASLHISWELLRAGVRPRARVPLLTRMSLEMLPAIIGILRVGACYAPIDVTAWGRPRIEAALEALSSPVAVATTWCAEVQLPVITVNFQKDWLHTPLLKNVEVLNVQLDARRSGLRSEDLVWILFTSGTTGKPKGIMIPHSAAYAYSLVQLMDKSTAEIQFRNLLAFSVAFDGCASVIWTTLTQGRTLVMASPSNFPDVSATCDALMLTPSMLEVLDPLGPYDGVGYIFLGAEDPSREVVRQWITPTRKVFTTYGPSETTCIVTLGRMDPDEETTLGQPLPGVKFVLVDDQLRECDRGEVLIAGPGVAVGYLNNEELTAQKFIQWNGERFYRTGDLARRTKSGELVWAGRADSLVKNRGFLINLETEVEPAMLSFVSVRRAVALKWRDRLIGYVQPATVDVVALREFLKSRVDPFVIPDEIATLDKVPLNANGKVDKAALRAQRERRLHPVPVPVQLHDTPDEPKAKLDALRSVFSTCLHVARGELDQASSFTALGGNSFTAIRVSQSLKRHGFEVSPVQILRLDTMGKLEQALQTVSSSEAPLATTGMHGGRIPVTPSQKLFLGRSTENPVAVALIGITEWVGDAHAMPTARELHGAFVKALSAHSIFSTRFHLDDMTLSSLGRLNLNWHDVSVEESELEQACVAAEQQAWKDAETLTRSDIEVPFFHVTCISVPGRKALAFVTHAHHILVDVVSQGIITRDVDRALAGAHVPAGPRIGDFAVFMERYKQQNLDEATRVVGDMVRPLSTTGVLQLPPPPPPPRPQTGLLRLDGPASVRKSALDAAARRLRCTSSTFVYAAWALFLSRISTEARVGFRVSLAGRTVPWPQAQSVVGCLVNSMPFSTAVPRQEHAGITVHDWLAKVHQTTLDLLALDGLGHALPASIMSDPRTNTTNVLCFVDVAPPSTANWKYTERQRHVYPIAWYAFRNEDNNVATWFEIQRQLVNEDWARSVAHVPDRMLEGLVNATEATLLNDLFV